MVKGEGAFSMVIKPLDDALTDNDHIHAVVRLLQLCDRFCIGPDVIVLTVRSLEQPSILVEPEPHCMFRVQLHSNSAF
jgi:hypothetical protein